MSIASLARAKGDVFLTVNQLKRQLLTIGVVADVLGECDGTFADSPAPAEPDLKVGMWTEKHFQTPSKAAPFASL